MNIDSKTKFICILGFPLGHSFSPAMHNRAFEIMGLNYLYIPVEVNTENLGDVVNGIAKMNFAGFNVTIPHKINIIKYLDEIDEAAEVIGAVNTVTINKGILKGYNTDGSGFVRYLEELSQTNIQGKKILIIGCGGSARAIAVNMALRGANKVYLCNRTQGRAVELAEEMNAKLNACFQALAMEKQDMQEALLNTDIVINTTPVGMHPNDAQIPVDPAMLNKNMIVCDIVYNPLKTRLLQEAEKIGCKTVNGLGMLLYQGVEAFKLWLGVDPPAQEMFEVLKKIALKR